MILVVVVLVLVLVDVLVGAVVVVVVDVDVVLTLNQTSCIRYVLLQQRSNCCSIPSVLWMLLLLLLLVLSPSQLGKEEGCSSGRWYLHQRSNPHVRCMLHTAAAVHRENLVR